MPIAFRISTTLLFVTLYANGATLYNNLSFTNAMAVSSRPGGTASEVEAADDFILSNSALVNSATFIGLYVPGASGGAASPTLVDIEFYRVFPNDSDTVRNINVNTRVNSPSDVAFASRGSAVPELSFQLTSLGSLTALNSVAGNGINPKPNQTTGGNGAVTGTVVQFNVTFNTAVALPADHYFFIPQVEFSNGGQFYWLSASGQSRAPAQLHFRPICRRGCGTRLSIRTGRA